MDNNFEVYFKNKIQLVENINRNENLTTDEKYLINL
jgi:hypothetical protein